jgi:hypothetical protein
MPPHLCAASRAIFFDVHHVPGFVVSEADVFANRGFEVHVRDRVLDAVEGRGDVVIAAAVILIAAARKDLHEAHAEPVAPSIPKAMATIVI